MPSDIGHIIADLESSDVDQQRAAAESLALLGEEARPGTVALVKSLRANDASARNWSIAALEGIGAPLPDQIEALIELAHDGSLDVAYWAVTLLGRGRSEASVERLIEVLNDSRDAVRERAAWALGEIGPNAKGAAPALRVAAASDSPRLARLAKAALESLGQTP